MILPGAEFSLTYPRTTHVGEIDRSKRTRRHLVAKRIRDLFESPLSAKEFLSRPYAARSRWQLLATEVTTGRPRVFHLGLSDEFQSPVSMQIIIVDRSTGETVKTIDRLFGATVEERDLLRRLVEFWESVDSGDYELKIKCLSVGIADHSAGTSVATLCSESMLGVDSRCVPG